MADMKDSMPYMGRKAPHLLGFVGKEENSLGTAVIDV